MKAFAQTQATPINPAASDASAALVHRAKCGDRQAFSDIYSFYSPKVYAYVLRHVSGEVEVAQDITADVFLKAMEHLESYRVRDVPFSSWLYRIAHNRVIDHYRRMPKQQPIALEDEGPLREKAVSLDASLILNRKVLRDAIELLTAEQRSVIILRLLQNRTVAETATAIGRSEDAVKQLQRRGLAALERILQTPTLAPMPSARS